MVLFHLNFAYNLISLVILYWLVYVQLLDRMDLANSRWFVDQVGTVLLSCAFMYDIFWVFVSKKLFHESVMIVVNILPPCLNLYLFFYLDYYQALWR